MIGAGIGGLSAALRLAARGLAVTVIDMAASPGGKMRTRPTEAGPVDIGPTVLTMRPVFETLFSDVGARLCDHVTLHRDPILARHWWRDGASLDLHADPGASADAVQTFAGSRARREFEAFAASARRLFEAFDGPVMQSARPGIGPLAARVLRNPGLLADLAPGLSLAQGLALRFHDPRLRQLFGRYATYVGGSPYRSPAVLGLIWHSEAQGVWSVAGGMQALAQALHDLAVSRGATFILGHRATRIERQGGRVSGVHLADGTRLGADVVVFNGDPKALSQGLLGSGVAASVPVTAIEPRSLSAFVWGFAAVPAGVELAHHNVFFGADPNAEFDDLEHGRMPRDATLYLCAQDRAAGTAPRSPGQLERFEIIRNGPAGHQTTDEEKTSCRTATFETLSGMGLRFSPIPGTEALTSPRDFHRDFPASDGSLYGRSPQGMRATFLRPTARTAIPGLYLAGGGAHPGAGVPMACLSGGHAAAAIMTDLASISTSRRTAMPGGMPTGSATTGRGRSPSSAS